MGRLGDCPAASGLDIGVGGAGGVPEPERKWVPKVCRRGDFGIGNQRAAFFSIGV